MCGECGGADPRRQRRTYALIALLTLAVVLAAVVAKATIGRDAVRKDPSCVGLSDTARVYGAELTRDLRSEIRLERDTTAFVSRLRRQRLVGCRESSSITRSARQLVAQTCPACVRQLRLADRISGT